MKDRFDTGGFDLDWYNIGEDDEREGDSRTAFWESLSLAK